MSITRRLFAKRAPAAVGAIGMLATQPPIPAPIPMDAAQPRNIVRGLMAEEKLSGRIRSPLELLMDKKRSDYRKEMNMLEQLQRTIASRGGQLSSMNNNIAALRSISNQHKVIMQENFHRRMHEERMTWRERLLSQFGLKSSEMYDDNGPANTASAGY